MQWLQIPVVPLLLALVLGKQLEEHLRVSLTASRGDVTVFFTSPFSVFFLCLSVVSIAWPFIVEKRRKKAAAALSSQ
jgi:putative tricarboxylic transport membrane protein